MGRSAKITSIILLFCFYLFFPKKSIASISFNISNPIINSDNEVEVDASISGLISSSCSTNGCYLQAEFQSAGGYFGYTYNNSGEYVDYFKTPGSIDEIKSKLFNFIPIGGMWSGKLKAKNNITSANYYGPGDYLLNFRRFSGNSLSPTSGESNSINVTLTLETPAPSPMVNQTPSPTPTTTPFVLKTASPSTTPSPSPLLTATAKTMPTASAKSSPAISSSSAISNFESTESQVLGVFKTPSSLSVENIADESSKAKPPILAILLILTGIVFIGFSFFSIIKNGEKKNIEVP